MNPKDSKETQPKDKAQTTIEELLKTHELTLPVRDFLQRYVDGQPLPYTAGLEEFWYGDAELLIAVLADAREDGKDSLPGAAHDYVQEYLYCLEESTQVHIWNDPDVLRAAYPIMMSCFGEGRWLAGEYPDMLATKTALSRLCTRRELFDFYERHGIKDGHKGRKDPTGSVSLDNPTDHQQAMKAARVLADPRTPAETRTEIQDAINELCGSTQVNSHHPALAERALTVMLETVDLKVKSQHGFMLSSIAERRRDRKHLFDLLNSLPDLPEPKKGGTR